VVAVGGRHGGRVSISGPSAGGYNDDDEEDIEDDFNWDSLIANDSNELTCAV